MSYINYRSFMSGMYRGNLEQNYPFSSDIHAIHRKCLVYIWHIKNEFINKHSILKLYTYYISNYSTYTLYI